MRTNRSYTKEFKLQAVTLAKENGNISQTANDLGINASMLRRWRREQQESSEDAFIGTGHSKTKTKEEQEMFELRKQLREVTMERDILKKAVHIFAKKDR